VPKSAATSIVRGIMKIRSRIAIANSIVFAAVLTILTVVLTFELRTLMLSRIEDQLVDKNDGVVSMIAANVTTAVKTHLRSVAEENRRLMDYYYRLYQQGVLSEEEALATVREIFVDPEYGKIGETGYLAGVDTSGVLAIHPRSEGVDASSFEFMQRAMEMKNGYLEYMWKNADEDTERAKAGWLAYFEPWDIMVWASSYRNEFVDMVTPADFREAVIDSEDDESGYSYIVDSAGTLIVHPTLEGESLYDAKDTSGHYFVREIIEEKDGSIQYEWRDTPESEPRLKLAVYSHLADLDWYVVTTYYHDELYAPLRRVTASLMIAMVASLIVVFVLNLVVGRIIAKPISRMTGVIGGGIADTIDLRTRLTDGSKDEVGQLGGLFNSLLDRIQGVVRNISDVGVRSNEIGENLAANSEQVSATMVEVSGTLRSFEEQSASLDSEISRTREAVTKVKTAVASITAAIEEQSAAVRQSSASTEEITASIRHITTLASNKKEELADLSGRAQEGKDELRGTADSIQEIAKSTSSIFELIEVIQKIASQTNLLAMNAAIEAAHAGDAGRGFAVVAEEIRTLAESTSKSTSTITESIKTILSKIETAKTSSESTGGRFQTMLDEIVSVADSLEEILGGMNEMSAGSEELLTTMQTLSQGNEEVQAEKTVINERIIDIEGASDNLAGLSAHQLEAVREISVSVGELTKATETLRDLGVRNAENITVIEEETAKFSV
jgi:methyl-accepting chemotaxis protein